MLCDPFGRKIDYLRISVTPHCNLRCLYCVPAMGCHNPQETEFLSREEIRRLAGILVRLGIRKIRLTGGEPLVRPDIMEIVRDMGAIRKLEDLALSSNGILLAPHARDLKKAGLRRLNISLDSLCPERFRDITRGGDFDRAWGGIVAAVQAGLNPVKLNVVLLKGFNDDEIADFARLTVNYPIHVRFIELMPKGNAGFFRPEHFLGVDEAQAACESVGPLVSAQEETSDGPAVLWRYAGARGCIGFIGAMTVCFCSRCNRLRLTAEGNLRPCLDWEEGIDLKGPMRRGASDSDLERLVRLAVLIKPGSHGMEFCPEKRKEPEPMCAIGG